VNLKKRKDIVITKTSFLNFEQTEMSQKINSTLFRMKTFSCWKSLYKECNKNEISYYLNQDLQIKEFVRNLFNSCNFVLCDLKLRRSRDKLELFITYFKKARILKYTKKSSTSPIDCKFISYTQRDFLKNLTESLLIALPVNLEVSVSVQCINKIPTQFISDRKHRKIFQAILFSLRRYSKDPGFSEFVNLLMVLVLKKCSADTFSKIVARELAKSKSHNKLFNFWRKALAISLESTLAKIKGVKLVIKGRINGRPRAKVIKIIAGSVPNQTLLTNIDYSESISFTKNGTFGVNVLICTG